MESVIQYIHNSSTRTVGLSECVTPKMLYTKTMSNWSHMWSESIKHVSAEYLRFELSHTHLGLF